MRRVARSAGECTDAALRERLTAYVFDELGPEEREQVDLHVIECDGCWRDLERLERAVSALRRDPGLRPRTQWQQMFSVLGMSGRIVRPFAGHEWFAGSVTLLYGAIWAAGIWVELGYSYDRFGKIILPLSTAVGLLAAGSLLAALWVDAEAAKRGKTTGLARAVAAAGALSAGIVALAMRTLPEEATIVASFQTRTASGGYLKDALLVFLPLLVFVLPTFNLVVRLQRELASGRYALVASLLAGRPEAVWPRGTVHLSPAVLSGLLLVLAALRVGGANNMLDALAPGPYANLFANATYVSVGLWLAMAIAGVWWYWSCLTELKRQSVGTRSFLERIPDD